MRISQIFAAMLLLVFLFMVFPAHAASVTPGLDPDEMARIMYEHYSTIEQWYYEEENKTGAARDEALIAALNKARMSQSLWIVRFCKVQPAACYNYKNK